MLIQLTTTDYTERIWRYQDNRTNILKGDIYDYTERIWRYQDNSSTDQNPLATDYTERIWRYQDNWIVIETIIFPRLYREDLAVSGQLRS